MTGLVKACVAQRALSVGLLALFAQIAMAGVTVPSPLRVVRVGHPSMPTYKTQIEGSVEACQVIRKLPQSKPKLPDDATLSKFVRLEVEELFDGANWAEYTTLSEIHPDPQRRCALTVFKTYFVSIERGCFDTAHGGSTLLVELTDYDHPKAPGFEFGEEAVPTQLRSPSDCKARDKWDPSGLPKVKAGAYACIWDWEFLKRDFKRAGLPWDDAAPEGTQACLLAHRPDHQAGGRHHTIALQVKAAVDPQEHQNLYANGEIELQTLAEGVAIDPAKFTRQGAERFLSQPARQNFGGQP
jgi:hypothetical protein